MLSVQKIQEFERDGFVNTGPGLDLDEIDELSVELDRILQIGPDGFNPDGPRPVLFRNMRSTKREDDNSPLWQIVNIWEASPVFERLIYHPFLVRVASQLTEHPELMVWHDQIQFKPAGGGPLSWHQDAPLWPIIKPMMHISAWIPIDDAEVDNGCMWMVPGSFKWGDQIKFLRTQTGTAEVDEYRHITGFTPPTDAEIMDVKPQPMVVKRGEVSFHHSLNWHGSPANKSGRRRRAIAIHYMTGETVYDASGEHPMKQFVELADGEPMNRAGSHFPIVCRDGEPLQPPSAVPS